jgi:hypothetical protein
MFHTLFFLESFNIWFKPTSYLGKYRISYNYHIYFSFIFKYILDIFCLTNGKTAIKTPFSSMNTLFVKNINGKDNCFLTNTESVENPEDNQKVDHYLTVTLLPNQILIFPKTIFENMDFAVLYKMQYYENIEIR